jgi:murein L,D-transpeptidase YafK
MKQLLFLLLLSTAAAARPAAPPTKPDHADRIVILKSKRILMLFQGEKVLRTYQVAIGTVPIGPKHMHGDHKTPEGNYRIDARNAHSHYHLGLHISYPNAIDRKNARRSAVSPGGDIMIHGLPPSYAYLGALHRQTDWTDGCIAVTDQEIEEIWQLVPVGTVVEIRP